MRWKEGEFSNFGENEVVLRYIRNMEMQKVQSENVGLSWDSRQTSRVKYYWSSSFDLWKGESREEDA